MAASVPPDTPDSRQQDVDELRRHLRALGYLDAGVDRFVLGDARGARRPAALAWLAAARIGAMAAALVGPLGALGVATRLSGLITGPRDAFVVAAYIGLVFGVAVVIAAATVILVVPTMAAGRRSVATRRSLAVASGAIFTAASLVYLTLWWDAAALNAAPLTAATVAALVLAAAISLLLGHAVTVAVAAVTLARAGAVGDSGGVPGASRRVTLVSAALTLCAAFLLFALSAQTPPATTAPPLTVVSTGYRVRLIAIDGFDPEVAQRLAGRGRIPAIAAVLAGAHASLSMDDTRDPARAWTTVATGQPAAVHAVNALETRRVAGLSGTIDAAAPSPLLRALGAVTDLARLTRPSIASGSERRVKSAWEVASDAGLRTLVVNWWASWPAPSGAGAIVTDRAPLRFERGGELDAEVAPASLYADLQRRWPGLRAQAVERAKVFTRDDDIGQLLRRSAELDALQLVIADAAAGEGTDLVCIYLPGLDLVQHALLSSPDGATRSPTEVASRLALLEDYYVFLDTLLGAPLQPRQGELVFLLTGPGRVDTRTSGLFALRGTAATVTPRNVHRTAVDVMPTVLQALGVPLSKELAGRPIEDLFAADFGRRYPVRSVSTYGRPSAPTTPRSGQPLDQEMIDRLRSLGYVR